MFSFPGQALLEDEDSDDNDIDDGEDADEGISITYLFSKTNTAKFQDDISILTDN